jgi:hypothetical protein
MSLARLAALGLALCVGGGAAAAGGASEKYCREDAVNRVVFLDVTSAYDDIARSSLVDGLGQIVDSLTDGEHITIRTIADEFGHSARLFSDCMPYCADEGLFSKCTEGVLIADRRAFRASLAKTLREVIAGSHELDHSEIVRTLSRAGGEELRAGRTNDFYIFSDMIENSAYLPGSRFLRERNKALILRLADDKLIPNLEGVSVRIFGFGRKGTEGRASLNQVQLDKMTEFWKLFFLASGATVEIQQNLTRNR